MFDAKTKYLAGIMLAFSICGALLILADQALGDTDDDDTTLHFHWTAASGDVDHYNVYLYMDGVKQPQTWTTAIVPTSQNPYAVPIVAEAGRMYQLQIQAEDASGTTGPMSEMSDPAWCQFPRSPGDVSDSTKGDADGNLRVGAGDWAILSKATGTKRGAASFDYRADLNYDHSVDQADFSTIASYWGDIYSDGPIVH